VLAGQQRHGQCEGRASGGRSGSIPVNQNRIGRRVDAFIADYWLATRPEQLFAGGDLGFRNEWPGRVCQVAGPNRSGANGSLRSRRSAQARPVFTNVRRKLGTVSGKQLCIPCPLRQLPVACANAQLHVRPHRHHGRNSDRLFAAVPRGERAGTRSRVPRSSPTISRRESAPRSSVRPRAAAPIPAAGCRSINGSSCSCQWGARSIRSP
jgi:hypothetical protein